MSDEIENKESSWQPRKWYWLDSVMDSGFFDAFDEGEEGASVRLRLGKPKVEILITDALPISASYGSLISFTILQGTLLGTAELAPGGFKGTARWRFGTITRTIEGDLLGTEVDEVTGMTYQTQRLEYLVNVEEILKSATKAYLTDVYFATLTEAQKELTGIREWPREEQIKFIEDYDWEVKSTAAIRYWANRIDSREMKRIRRDIERLVSLDEEVDFKGEQLPGHEVVSDKKIVNPMIGILLYEFIGEVCKNYPNDEPWIIASYDQALQNSPKIDLELVSEITGIKIPSLYQKRHRLKKKTAK